MLRYLKPNTPLRHSVPPTPVASLCNRYSLVIFLLSSILVFAKGYNGDLSYWQGWITHLAQKGYTDFNANYPPVYIHWLWLVSKVYSVFELPLERDHVLKLFAVLPSVVCHVALLRLVAGLPKFKIQSINVRHGILALIALNPAIYYNGVIWGQVDLLPNFLIIVALLFCLQGRNVLWVPGLFVLAFLTKFQMVLFAPIFAGFFFCYWREYLKGIIPLVIIVLCVLTPYLLVGNTLNMFHHAYLDTVSQYPYLTFNAANFWYWFAGNMVSDELGVKKIAFALFFVISCIVMIGVAKAKNPARALDWANIMPITFFTILPGMHERYLFAAIPLAILWVCFNPTKIRWAVMISVFCTINMLLVFPLQGDIAWWMLSLGIIGLFVCFWGQVILPARKLRQVNEFVVKKSGNFTLTEIRTGFFWLLLMAIFTFKQEANRIHFERADNEILLTALPIISKQQDYSTLKINQTVGERSLTVNGQVYEYGFGTHANSSITFNIPKGAIGFKSVVALDDEAKAGKIQFQVFIDGASYWKSEEMTWLNAKSFCSIDFRAGSTITLKVLSLQDNSHDHADWINPVFIMK